MALATRVEVDAKEVAAAPQGCGGEVEGWEAGWLPRTNARDALVACNNSLPLYFDREHD